MKANREEKSEQEYELDLLRKVDGPMSLYEYAKLESGLEGAALTRYINRHYGHG